MNRKRVMKRLTRHLGIRLPILFSSEYAIELKEDRPTKIFVQQPKEGHGLSTEIILAQAEWTKEFLAKHQLKISYHAFSMLHEIGHIKSEQGSYEEYEKEIKSIKMAFLFGKVDEKTWINSYNNIKDEINASKWAIDWIKKNKKTAEWLNSSVN